LDANYTGFTVSDKTLSMSYYDTHGDLQFYEFESLDNILATDSDFTGFVGFLHLDNRVLPDKKTKYEIHYELLRDN
jgi:hypothetical protein